MVARELNESTSDLRRMKIREFIKWQKTAIELMKKSRPQGPA